MTTDATIPPTADSVPQRRLDARVRNYRDTMIVAGPIEAHELSETAALVWRSIDGERTVADIAAILATEYDVDEPTALSDCIDLLAGLSAGGIVTY